MRRRLGAGLDALGTRRRLEFGANGLAAHGREPVAHPEVGMHIAPTGRELLELLAELADEPSTERSPRAIV
jgi:hypothetical protein